jgi:hypothetical protein
VVQEEEAQAVEAQAVDEADKDRSV